MCKSLDLLDISRVSLVYLFVSFSLRVDSFERDPFKDSSDKPGSFDLPAGFIVSGLGPRFQRGRNAPRRAYSNTLSRLLRARTKSGENRPSETTIIAPVRAGDNAP